MESKKEKENFCYTIHRIDPHLFSHEQSKNIAVFSTAEKVVEALVTMDLDSHTAQRTVKIGKYIDACSRNIIVNKVAIDKEIDFDAEFTIDKDVDGAVSTLKDYLCKEKLHLLGSGLYHSITFVHHVSWVKNCPHSSWKFQIKDSKNRHQTSPHHTINCCDGCGLSLYVAYEAEKPDTASEYEDVLVVSKYTPQLDKYLKHVLQNGSGYLDDF
jgi:hypothetical protein